MTLPKPPATHEEFVTRYPKLREAWGLLHEAGEQGPLDARATRLVRLAIAIGAMREGAVHSNTRKALSEGLRPEEIEQVVALAAGTLGMPATVAVYSWVRDCADAGSGE